MNFYVIFAFLFVAVAATMAAPDQLAKDEPFKEQFEANENALEEEIQERGWTCSVGGNGACVAKCYALGKPGGYCNKEKTCICYQRK